MTTFFDLLINLACGINLLTCIEASHPTNVFNAALINIKEKTYITKFKRDKYDSSLVRKFLRLNNSTLYFQDINDINNFFTINIPYSVEVRDILNLSDKKLLVIGSLYPSLYEIDITSKSIKKLPFKFDEFEFMNGIKFLNDIYITGFKINPKNGMPYSNGNIYKLNPCISDKKYCISKIKTKPVNTYRSLGLICKKTNECIPVIKDFYDLNISVKTLDDEKYANTSCQKLYFSKNQFRRTLIPSECSEKLNLEFPDIFKNLFQNNFTIKVGKKEDGSQLIGKIYATKDDEFWQILDVNSKNVILRKISTNDIYLINQNEFSLLNKKLNKSLLNKAENKSDIYHISGLKNKLYVSNMLVNNLIYSYDFNNGKGNWIKLDPLQNQENGQPQIIVPIEDDFLIVFNYPYSKGGLYKLDKNKGILLKELSLNSSERFDRPVDFLECRDKNILVVQRDSDYGLNNKKYFFVLPKKLIEKDLKYIDKIPNIDSKEIKDCYSFFSIKNPGKYNYDFNYLDKNYPLPITKGLTNRPISIKDSSHNNFCIPLKHKVICTKDNFYKRIILSMIDSSE